MQVIIKTNQNSIEVYTPYHQDFVRKIKQLKGSWKNDKKCWIIKKGLLEEVREILDEVYGETDIDVPAKLNIEIMVTTDIAVALGDVTFLGKTLCHASGRDSGGRAGEEVFYLKSEPKSGGSSNKWQSIVKKGSRIKLENVSKTLFNRYKNESWKDFILILSVKPVNENI